MLSEAPALLTPKSETASSAAETSAILIFIHHPPSDSDRQFVIVILWLTENHMPAALSCQSLHSNRSRAECRELVSLARGDEGVERQDLYFLGTNELVCEPPSVENVRSVQPSRRAREVRFREHAG